MARYKRAARDLGAFICFEDEAGQGLRPPKGRTWAPRGARPLVKVRGKGGGGVSIAGVACYRPGDRPHFFYRMRFTAGRKGERRAMSEADYAGLIIAAHRQLAAPLVCGLGQPQYAPQRLMRDFTGAHPDWLTVVQLPAYAPDLNPVEMGLPQCELRRSSLS